MKIKSYIRIFASVAGAYSVFYDIMKPGEGDSWKLHVLKTPWSPPDYFSWPISVHKKKNKTENRLVFQNYNYIHVCVDYLIKLLQLLIIYFTYIMMLEVCIHFFSSLHHART